MLSLSRDAFQLALCQGRGEAWLYVKQAGLSQVSDLLLAACLKNIALDPQLDASRGRWLYGMFSGSTYEPEFRQAILTALMHENETWSLLQLCELAMLMAADGDTAARAGLWQRIVSVVGRRTGHSWMGAELWIELNGFAGLYELAQLCGQRLLQGAPFFSLPELFTFDTTREADLRTLAPGDAELQAYFDAYDQDRQASQTFLANRAQAESMPLYNWRRSEAGLQRLLRQARRRKFLLLGRYRTYGLSARPAELRVIYRQLLNARHPAVQARLLSVFIKPGLLGIPAALFDWARSRHAELRSAALAVLVGVADRAYSHRIRALMLSELADQQFDEPEILGLLDVHYRAEDGAVLSRALADFRPNPDQAHALGRRVLVLAQHHPDSSLNAALCWAYTQQPCASCRFDMLDQLSERGLLNSADLKICLHDVNVEIRTWAEHRLAITNG